jgi:hypothetical protein
MKKNGRDTHVTFTGGGKNSGLKLIGANVDVVQKISNQSKSCHTLNNNKAGFNCHFSSTMKNITGEQFMTLKLFAVRF